MKTVRIYINLFTAIAPFAAWIFMIFGISGGTLSSTGVKSLKYFTTLSNLLEGTASIIWLLSVIRMRFSHTAEVIKFVAALSVSLTFITVLTFLGPLYGYGSMFKGANFWFHLVIPVAALLEMVLFVRETFSVGEVALSIIPVLVYGIFYLRNILIHGRGDAVSGWNDFYGFAAWGIPIGVAIFTGICAGVFGLGMVLRQVVRVRG